MSEWQPIETAPKDGRLILAWFVGQQPEPIVVRYVDADPFSWAPAACITGSYSKHFVTHWMPLPEPPK